MTMKKNIKCFQPAQWLHLYTPAMSEPVPGFEPLISRSLAWRAYQLSYPSSHSSSCTNVPLETVNAKRIHFLHASIWNLQTLWSVTLSAICWSLDSSIGKSTRVVIWRSEVRIPVQVQIFLLKFKFKYCILIIFPCHYCMGCKISGKHNYSKTYWGIDVLIYFYAAVAWKARNLEIKLQSRQTHFSGNNNYRTYWFIQYNNIFHHQIHICICDW